MFGLSADGIDLMEKSAVSEGYASASVHNDMVLSVWQRLRYIASIIQLRWPAAVLVLDLYGVADA
jgi:hypothetical protein